MKTNNQSRRKFLTNSAALAAASMVPLNFAFKNPSGSTGEKLNSKFGGVNIGAITYSWRSMPGGVENIIKYCQECNISSLELMSNDLEAYLGIPENPRRRGRGQLTPEQQAEIENYNQAVKEWRLSLPISKVEAAKKLFDDAGINIHIVKFSPSGWSDEEIDWAFKVAKAMGAKGVCEEISENAAKKLAPFAEKHGMYAVFHQHMQFADVEGFSYDPYLDISPAVMFNFDAGHFFGSTGRHPNEILQKYHDRIFSIHIKDKTGPDAEIPNTNQVWGQGQMPLEDVLLLIKKEKWPIYCDIELEYEVKPWSDAVKEVKTCVNYARQILM